MDNRMFVEAVLYIARTGLPWRDLPDEFGSWNSVYRRFCRWSDKGVWEQIFAELAKKATSRKSPSTAPQCVSINMVRAQKKEGPQNSQKSLAWKSGHRRAHHALELIAEEVGYLREAIGTSKTHCLEPLRGLKTSLCFYTHSAEELQPSPFRDKVIPKPGGGDLEAAVGGPKAAPL